MSSKVKYLSSILTPVSLGELIDKITILEIKQIHMTGIKLKNVDKELKLLNNCLLYTSPSPRDQRGYRMPSSA